MPDKERLSAFPRMLSPLETTVGRDDASRRALKPPRPGMAQTAPRLPPDPHLPTPDIALPTSLSPCSPGRVAMLAFLGFVVQEFIRLPGDMYSEPNGVKAFFQVGPQPLIQIFLFCGFLEFTLHKGKMTQMDMFADGKREPGNFGFDPLGFGKDPSKRERLALAELKNGRLAMIAIGGLIHHALVTGHATFSS